MRSLWSQQQNQKLVDQLRDIAKDENNKHQFTGDEWQEEMELDLEIFSSPYFEVHDLYLRLWSYES